MTHQWLTNRARTGWLAGAVAGAALVVTLASIDFTPAAHSAPTAPNVTTGSFADVFEAVSPAVVNINVTQTESTPTSGVYRFNAPQGQGRGAEELGGCHRAPFGESQIARLATHGHSTEREGQQWPQKEGRLRPVAVRLRSAG